MGRTKALHNPLGKAEGIFTQLEQLEPNYKLYNRLHNYWKPFRSKGKGSHTLREAFPPL